MASTFILHSRDAAAHASAIDRTADIVCIAALTPHSDPVFHDQDHNVRTADSPGPSDSRNAQRSCVLALELRPRRQYESLETWESPQYLAGGQGCIIVSATAVDHDA